MDTYTRDAMDDADASLEAEAEELGFESAEAMLIATEEAYLARRDYEVMQGAK